MFIKLIALLIILNISFQFINPNKIPNDEEHIRLWKAFKAYHNKTQNNDENMIRFSIFRENIKAMVKNNISNSTHTLGFTKFADMTSDEFKFYKGFNGKMSQNNLRQELQTSLSPNAPSSVDWRNKGVLTAVKNQAQCGSCWAFSAIETLESHEVIVKNNPLVVLSEQELVDCDTIDSGCGGGLMQNAYTWLTGKGIESESDYGYKAVNQTCKYNKSLDVFTNVTGYTMIGSNQNALTNATVKQPVAIAVDAGNNWQLYTGGVLSYSNCSGTALDHGVQVVGYTSDQWIVRNSWASTWGESGFIRLQRGDQQNTCGLWNNAVIPNLS